MADWEPERQSAKASPQARGIYLNVELGISFWPNDRRHTISMNHASRSMRGRIHQQQRENHFPQPHPPILQPGNGPQNGRQVTQQRSLYETPDYQQQLQRQGRLEVRPREQHERGSSAPPSFSHRNGVITPRSVQPVQQVSGLVGETMERTPPADPPRFRLCEEDLPWPLPPCYRPPESKFTNPILQRPRSSLGFEGESKRLEDPQRARDLGTLHQAMLTVDSLDHEGWETWTRDSVADAPRGSRALGWAVSQASPDTLAPPASFHPPLELPPPYVVSQWEQAFGRSGGLRPRSMG